MGKRIIAQRRGGGSPRYSIPSHLFRYEAKYIPREYMNNNQVDATVVDIIKSNAHSAPLLKVKALKNYYYIIAPEGISVGEKISFGLNESKKPKTGDVLFLKDIDEGSIISNVESTPGDGGKFVRASGSYARVISKTESYVLVQFPSKKTKKFPLMCRATVGVVAGGGRTEKPLFKAGRAHYKAKAKHKLYPITSGTAMNAGDHPYGHKRTQRKANKICVARGTPPGRKVGSIAARRTGKRK
ncbi:MAG: 50S ribosomal protein L2 [Nitrospiraceae bacterium]|nr:50S ribosomal protein L2 [Nitrospiraceae bacterium]